MIAGTRWRSWLADCAVGGAVGGVIGAIVAVNLVILSGIDEGYEASLGDVLQHNRLMGVVVIAVLAAGPVLGAVLARRMRRTRERGSPAGNGG